VQEAILEQHSFRTLDDALLAIGAGEITAHAIALQLASLIAAEEEAAAPVATPVAAPRRERAATGVYVLGAPNLLTRFANCCHPLPGDPIAAYITRGRGATIHRSDCHNVVHSDEHERIVDAQWGSAPGTRYAAQLRIEGWDRVGFVRDISTVVADEGVNMVGLRTDEQQNARVVVQVTLETDGMAQLQRVMHKLDALRGVLGVERSN
jgi:guanosine-3',5'-bis(diphosphate) 3'-pyrophosphohydrolase